MNENNLTTEQQEVISDLVEFYNSHDVETVRFGHTRRYGELGIWSWSFVTFTLKTDRTVLFRFKRTLITSAFEEWFCYLIHQKTTKLFPDEGGCHNEFAWRKDDGADYE